MRRVVVPVLLLSVGFAAGVVVAPWLGRNRSPLAAATLVDGAERPALSASEPVAATESGPAGVRKIPSFITTPAPTGTPPNGPHVLALEDLPVAARDFITRLSAGKPLKHLSIEVRTKNGVRFNRAFFELDGLERELHFDLQGALNESQTQVATNEMPARVQDALSQALPGSGLLQAKKLEGSAFPLPVYEIDLASGGTRRRAQVTEAGDIIGIKVK
jgi:hypothetical protein